MDEGGEPYSRPVMAHGFASVSKLWDAENEINKNKKIPVRPSAGVEKARMKKQ